MSVNLSIKNVPEHLVQRLRERAARSHRSLQGELMTILEETLRQEQSLTPTQLLAQVRARGLQTEADASRIVRADRDRG